jgi:hypothetical protein
MCTILAIDLPPPDAPASAFRPLIDGDWSFLAEGTSRMAYKHPDRDDWILKDNPARCGCVDGEAPSDRSMPHHCHGANNREINEWLSELRIGRCAATSQLGEIVTWSACRQYLIMEYLRDLGPEEDVLTGLPFTDRKRKNFGADKKDRIKMRDYTERTEPLPSSSFAGLLDGDE